MMISSGSDRSTYEAYIRSDEWRERADVAKKRAGYRCQICNRGDITLNVHHRTYERLGNELPEDLTVLCRNCHELFELNKRIATTPTPPSPARAAPDRERYCLTELLRAPSPREALRAIDAALSRADLPAFDVEDFEDVTHRAAFAALQATLADRSDPKIDDVLDRLDRALQAEVSTWVESPVARPATDPDTDETRCIVDAALLLRERNLKNHDAQLTNLIRDAAEEDDSDSLRDLSQTKLAVSDQLKRLSRIRYATNERARRMPPLLPMRVPSPAE